MLCLLSVCAVGIGLNSVRYKIIYETDDVNNFQGRDAPWKFQIRPQGGGRFFFATTEVWKIYHRSSDVVLFLPHAMSVI